MLVHCVAMVSIVFVSDLIRISVGIGRGGERSGCNDENVICLSVQARASSG